MTTILAKHDHWIPMTGKLFGFKSLNVPADFTLVCLWATSGLIATALVATVAAFGAGAGALEW
jgi:hypothetical protein